MRRDLNAQQHQTERLFIAMSSPVEQMEVSAGSGERGKAMQAHRRCRHRRHQGQRRAPHRGGGISGCVVGALYLGFRWYHRRVGSAHGRSWLQVAGRPGAGGLVHPRLSLTNRPHTISGMTMQLVDESYPSDALALQAGRQAGSRRFERSSMGRCARISSWVTTFIRGEHGPVTTL